MSAETDKYPSLRFQDIRGKKCHGRIHGRTDGQRENSNPTTNSINAFRKTKHNVKTDTMFLLCILSLPNRFLYMYIAIAIYSPWRKYYPRRGIS